MEVAKNMDSVFGIAADDSLDFDIMFDQDDSLVDLVNGFNEAGDPLTGVDFVDLHQTQDDATPDDVRDVQSDDQPMGAKNIEGSKEVKPEDNSLSNADLNKDSEADKFIDNADKDYQDGKDQGTAPKADNVTDVVDKVIEGADEAPTGAEGTKPAEVLDTTVTQADLNKDSDADKFIDNADKDYQADKDQGPKPDEDSVEDTIVKAVEATEFDDIIDDEDDDLLDESFKERRAARKEKRELKKEMKKEEKEDKLIDKADKKAVKEGCKEESCDSDSDKEVEESAITLESIEQELAEEVDILTLEDIEYELQEEADIDEQDIMGEIEDKKDKDIQEAGDVDADVAVVDDADVDDEDDIIDAAMGSESSSSSKYEYEPSDEDLIDDVINAD